MSQRQFVWNGPVARRRRAAPRGAIVPWVLAGLTVLLQIAYPLTSGQTRTSLTLLTVVMFFLASATHAWLWRGAAWALGYLGITVIGGWAVESFGRSHDVLFGPYDYTSTLGWKFGGVPLVIPLSWAMMAYPSLLVGQRIVSERTVRSRIAMPFVAGLALASWDLFLDPMMVADGHWAWQRTTPAIPGISGIPAHNFLGWYVVAVVMMALLGLLPRVEADDAQPLALWMWTYVSSVLANAVFLHRPSVALVGGIVMGLVAVPLAVTVWRDRP
jgi:uncharacterized membrane protein